MKIALIGYGKMGHAIERIAQERGHEIVLKISSANKGDLTADNLKKADVAIEFTQPEVAFENVAMCLEAGVSVVCGTTGWNERFKEAEAIALKKGTGFLHASNFSVGVNIFFELNRQLVRLMSRQPTYTVSIEEVHHLQKKDKPSGTAISLAEQILDESDSLKGWTLSEGNSTHEKLPITALREEGVPGTHTISWSSDVDTINIEHIAHSRDGFAQGAVLAAEFVIGKKGVFTMKNVLAI